MDAFVIDAFKFCRMKDRREGEFQVEGLPRLSRESIDGFGGLRWTLQGGESHLGHPQLELSVSGSVKLTCQRCLLPFVFPVQSEAVLVLAESEGAANEIEDLLDDEDIEVIVGSNALSIMELVEDDALLAIPLSPRHDECPSGAIPDAVKAVEKESPFAVLKKLKQ
jgi:uncharacterized protein